MKTGILIISSLLILSGASSGQNKYYKYTLDNFRDSKIFQETIEPENLDFERLNALVFYLTNEVRKENGLSVLEYKSKLEESAMIHSKSMVEHDFFDHENGKEKKYRTPKDRAKAVGISNPYIAENIIESFVLDYTTGVSVYPGGPGVFRLTPDGDPIRPRSYLELGESMLTDWMNSAHHKSNILHSQALELGCGTALFYKKDFNYMPTVVATQNFQLYEPLQITQ